MARLHARAGASTSELRPPGLRRALVRPAARPALVHVLAAGALATLLVSPGVALASSDPPPAAPPGAWFATFTPEAIEPLFDGAEVSVAVCSVGPDDPSARTARKALEAALRVGARTRLVAPGRALEAAADETGEQLAARCARPPATVTAVLRMASGPEAPGPEITFHHVRHGVLAAALVEPGREVRLEGFTPALDRHVVADASDPAAIEGARDAYRRSFVWIEDPMMAREASRRPVAFKGSQREPLEGGEFYDAIGRADLARSYRQARAMQIGVGALGLLAAATGVYLMFDDDQALPIRDAGPSLAVCGVALALAPLDTDGAHPVSAAAARGLAEDYNRNLMAQLGLTQRRVTDAPEVPEPEAHATRPEPDQPPDVRVRFGLGGAGVFGRF